MNDPIAWTGADETAWRRDPWAALPAGSAVPRLQIESPDTGDAFTVAKNAAFFDWWQGLDGGACPHRKQFDITEHVDWAANVFLIRVESADPWVYRYRLIGNEAVQILGRNHTGLALSETAWDRFDAAASRAYDGMMERRRPLRFYGCLDRFQRDYARFESVDAPFLGEDGRVAAVIGLICRV